MVPFGKRGYARGAIRSTSVRETRSTGSTRTQRAIGCASANAGGEGRTGDEIRRAVQHHAAPPLARVAFRWLEHYDRSTCGRKAIFRHRYRPPARVRLTEEVRSRAFDQTGCPGTPSPRGRLVSVRDSTEFRRGPIHRALPARTAYGPARPTTLPAVRPGEARCADVSARSAASSPTQT